MPSWPDRIRISRSSAVAYVPGDPQAVPVRLGRDRPQLRFGEPRVYLDDPGPLGDGGAGCGAGLLHGADVDGVGIAGDGAGPAHPSSG